MSVESAFRIIEKLPELVKKDRRYKEKVIDVIKKLLEDEEIAAAVVGPFEERLATKEDIKALIEMMNRRFEEVNRRFEEVNRRFESMDARFNALVEEMNRRFEEVNRRFEEVNDNLMRIWNVLKEHGMMLSKKVEDVVDNTVRAIIGLYGGKVLMRYKTIDMNGDVFSPGTEIEINAISFDPPVMVEYTSYLRREDIDMIVKKRRYMEMMVKRMYGRDVKFEAIYVAMDGEKDIEAYGKQLGVKVVITR